MAQLNFPTSPTPGFTYAAPNGVTYTWDNTIGTGVWRAAVTIPLSVSYAGTVIGTAISGSTLTFILGTATGGLPPYTYTWVWRKASDNSVLQTGGSTYKIPGSLAGDRVYVTLTATDATPTTATGNTANYPAAPATIVGSTFPNSSFTPSGAPNASPASVNTGSLFGTASCSSWADGSTTLSSTGGIVFQVGAGPFSSGPTPVSNGNTVNVIWDPATIASAADGAILNGTLTDGTYINSYSITIDRSVTGLAFTDLTSQATTTAVTSNVITPGGFNVPVSISFAGTSSNPLTSLGVSVQGGAFSASPQSVNPGQTVQMRGTTGGSNSVAYGVDITMGSSPSATDTWTATTTAAVPSITTPSITSPANGTTGINPSLNIPSGVSLVGSAYSAQNGAGAQTSSTWQVYKGGFPLGPSTNSITTVSPGSAGTPGTTIYKTSVSTDTNPNSQNSFYGKLATDQFNDAAHPLFQWAKSLSINGYTDWYIPSISELGIIYFFFKPSTGANVTNWGNNFYSVSPYTPNTFYGPGFPSQTTNSLFQSGGLQAFRSVNPSNYWASTEYGATPTDAWRLNFTDGNWGTTANKNTPSFARAIRRIPISEYTAAGSPPIGTFMAGGFYAGKISTTANNTADYALILAPNPTGTFGMTGFTNASLTISGADTDGFVAGLTIKGNTSNATGVILSVNSTTIEYLPLSGTFVTGETITVDPTSYSVVSGSPFSVTSGTLTSVNVPKASLTTSSTYYARAQYATTNTSAATSSFSGWSSFSTATSFALTIGSSYGGGYYAGQINDGGTIYNLVIAPVTSGSLQGQYGGAVPNNIIWKTSATGPDTTAQSLVYGAPATVANSSVTFPMFNWCVFGATGPNAGTYDATNATGTGIGGYNDWYIPARNELSTLYYFLKPTTNANNTGAGSNANAVAPQPVSTNYTAGSPAQTTADGTAGTANFRSGGAQAISTSNYYWSASENSGSPGTAWWQEFGTGAQSAQAKNFTPFARAIRRVQA